MDFAPSVSSNLDLVLCRGRCVDGLGAMTTVTSSVTQKVNFGMAVKRRLSGPRYFMTGHWFLQLIVVLIFIFFQGLNTPHGIVTLQLAPERMAEIFGLSDQGSFLKAALNLIATGKNTPAWAWVLNVWPPGMVWLDAGIIRFSPFDFGVTIGMITALIWSAPLAVLTWPFMRGVKSALVVLMVELAILGTSPFQSWMFDEGLFYADGLAAGLLLFGLALIVNRARSDAPLRVWIRDGIYVGIAFSAAIYLRAAYLLVPWVLAVLALAIGCMIIIKRIRGLPTVDLGRQVALLFIAALTVPLLMHPYTVYLQKERARTQFVTTQDIFYNNVWQSRQLDKVPQWLLNGGSTLGCDIDPGECALIHHEKSDGRVFTPQELRNALLRSILTHPVEFAGNRVSHVTEQWFADEIGSYSYAPTDYKSGPIQYSASNNLNPGQGLLFLVLLIVANILGTFLAFRGKWALLIIPLTTLALLGPFALVQIEVRYLIPLKLIGLLAPILILMLREQPSRSPSPQTEGS